MPDTEHSSRWRRWFGSTGAPPQTALVAYMVCGGVAGALLGLALDPAHGALLGAITASLIAAAGSHGPSQVALSVAGWAATLAVTFVFVAFVVAGHPWWAAAAVAAVALCTSALAGAGPVGTALAQLGLLIYVLAVVVGTVAHLAADVSLASGAARIVLGAAAGLLVGAVGAKLRDRRDPAAAAAAPRPPSPWPTLWHSLRSFDEHARDGVRRAIPLAVGMFLYERSGGRDALWIFLAAFVVLMPAGRSPAVVAVARVVSTVVGVVLLGLFSLVVPDAALLSLAFAALLVAIVFQRTYPLVAGGLSAMGAVLLVGAPTGAMATWAGHRLLDTVIGCALALGSMYLLWPRDRSDVPVAGEGESPSPAPEASP